MTAKRERKRRTVSRTTEHSGTYATISDDVRTKPENGCPFRTDPGGAPRKFRGPCETFSRLHFVMSDPHRHRSRTHRKRRDSRSTERSADWRNADGSRGGRTRFVNSVGTRAPYETAGRFSETALFINVCAVHTRRPLALTPGRLQPSVGKFGSRAFTIASQTQLAFSRTAVFTPFRLPSLFRAPRKIRGPSKNVSFHRRRFWRYLSTYVSDVGLDGFSDLEQR